MGLGAGDGKDRLKSHSPLAPRHRLLAALDPRNSWPNPVDAGVSR